MCIMARTRADSGSPRPRAEIALRATSFHRPAANAPVRFSGPGGPARSFLRGRDDLVGGGPPDLDAGREVRAGLGSDRGGLAGQTGGDRLFLRREHERQDRGGSAGRGAVRLAPLLVRQDDRVADGEIHVGERSSRGELADLIARNQVRRSPGSARRIVVVMGVPRPGSPEPSPAGEGTAP
jgi:hypothetical protein